MKMFHFKHSNGGISFIGYDEEKKIYSLDYYANVGIINAEESEPVKYGKIKELRSMVTSRGYKQVYYLKEADL